MSDAPYQGRCLCGAIQYQAQKVSDKMGHCHCTMCRKFHGAAFATYGAALKNDFSWLKGEAELQTFKAENGTKRRFCKRCGSSLVFESAQENGLVEFSLATLDVAPSLAPDAHIYTGSKVPWFSIAEDDLPKYLNGRST